MPAEPSKTVFFDPPPGNLPTLQGEVHLWRIPLMPPDEGLGPLRTWLSIDEVGRADRLRLEAHRRRFVIAHAALRLILSRYLGQSPETIVLDRGEHGKPRLASSKGPVRPEFNLAHAGDLALLALAGPDCSIGVDLERVRDLKNIRKVAASVFTPAECELVFAASPGDPRPAFYRAWTRKEAISKGIGKGLQLRFDQWEVLAPETPCERPPILFRHPASDQEWAIWDLRLSDDYLAALAMVRTPQRVRFYDGGPLR